MSDLYEVELVIDFERPDTEEYEVKDWADLMPTILFNALGATDVSVDDVQMTNVEDEEANWKSGTVVGTLRLRKEVYATSQQRAIRTAARLVVDYLEIDDQGGSPMRGVGWCSSPEFYLRPQGRW